MLSLAGTEEPPLTTSPPRTRTGLYRVVPHRVQFRGHNHDVVSCELQGPCTLRNQEPSPARVTASALSPTPPRHPGGRVGGRVAPSSGQNTRWRGPLAGEARRPHSSVKPRTLPPPARVSPHPTHEPSRWPENFSPDLDVVLARVKIRRFRNMRQDGKKVRRQGQSRLREGRRGQGRGLDDRGQGRRRGGRRGCRRLRRTP